MKAVTYQGPKNVEVIEAPDPTIQEPDDSIVRLTSTAICGSDLHLIYGLVPNLPTGNVIGHEPVGVVEEVGPEVVNVQKGDRMIVPFNVSCCQCRYCQGQLTSLCDNANPLLGSWRLLRLQWHLWRLPRRSG